MASSAREYVAHLISQAQCCIGYRADPSVAPDIRAQLVMWFIHHVTTAVLLEQLRRHNPTVADQLVPWLLNEDGIFSDDYVNELVHDWRAQLAAGQELAPIGPDTAWLARSLGDVDVVDTEAVQQALWNGTGPTTNG